MASSTGEHTNEGLVTSVTPAVRLAEIVLDLPYVREDARPFTETILPGEAVAIVGGNRSGKSALVRTLLGLERPRQGRVRLMGVNLYRAGAEQVAAVLARLGFVLPDGGLFSGMNVFDNVALQMRYHGMDSEARIRERVGTWLERLDLMRYANKRPTELPVGTARRVAVARALVHEPEVVVFDEPFAYLDDDTSEKVESMIRDLLQRHVTLILATLGGTRVSRLVQRHLHIERGIVREPSPRDAIPASDEVDVRELAERLQTPEPTSTD